VKCPRCLTNFAAKPDPAGMMVCPGCGAKLRSKAAGTAARAAAAPGSAAEMDAALSRIGPPAGPPAAPARPPRGGASRSPSRLAEAAATLPPGTPVPDLTRDPDTAAETPVNGDAVGALQDALGRVLEELRALREGQDRMMALLSAAPPPAAPAVPPAAPALRRMLTVDEYEDDEEAPMPPTPPVVRSGRRKSVLLIDDDAHTRVQALEALQTAEVPVRAASSGNEGLAAIASDRPDVIVLELACGGDMAGKDVVNMIKATMEWVDIPIVLYTRLSIDGQKEARQIHGADELVLKGPGGADALVARVIALFRR
jgi:CheY-like chemotaxis protein